MTATTTTIEVPAPAAEKPLAARYVDQLETLLKDLAPVLDYHKSLEMDSFARGDRAKEQLHRGYVGKLSNVFHHLEANAEVARLIAKTGGAQ